MNMEFKNVPVPAVFSEVVTIDAPFIIEGQHIEVVTTELEEERPKKVPKHGQLMTCTTCCKVIKGRNEYVKHQRAMHPEQKAGTIKCLEPSCGFASYRLNQLTEHLKKDHELQVVVINEEFDDEESFQAWKSEYEMESNSQYRLTSSKYSSTWRYFNCSRTGFYNPKQEVKRRSKLSGTSKMNGHCIAGMVVKTDGEQKVSVVFTQTHYGHEVEPSHLRLGQSVRGFMEAMLNKGDSPTVVAAKINSLNIAKNRTEVTKKDVLNVVYSMQNKRLDNKFSFKSPLSVWDVSNDDINLKDSILFHKARGELSPDQPSLNKKDFMLCVFSPKQMMNIHKFAERGLCIEVNRGSNDGVMMCIVTIMSYEVSDKKKRTVTEDVPLSWCLSTADNPEMKRVFFSLLRERCGDLEPPFVLSNEWNETYDAWCQVFGGRPVQVVSPWAVHDAIDAAIKFHVIGHDRQYDLSKEVEAILAIEEPDRYERHMSRLLHDMAERVEYRCFFVEYFTKRFVENPVTGWAVAHYCDYKKNVETFITATSDARAKMKSFANKRVGRCVNLLLRHYTTRLHYMDTEFVRKRKRGRKSDPENQIPVVDPDVAQLETVMRFLSSILKNAKKGKHVKNVNFAKRQLEKCLTIAEESPCTPSELLTRRLQHQKVHQNQTEMDSKVKQARMENYKSEEVCVPSKPPRPPSHRVLPRIIIPNYTGRPPPTIHINNNFAPKVDIRRQRSGDRPAFHLNNTFSPQMPELQFDPRSPPTVHITNTFAPNISVSGHGEVPTIHLVNSFTPSVQPKPPPLPPPSSSQRQRTLLKPPVVVKEEVLYSEDALESEEHMKESVGFVIEELLPENCSHFSVKQELLQPDVLFHVHVIDDPDEGRLKDSYEIRQL